MLRAVNEWLFVCGFVPSTWGHHTKRQKSYAKALLRKPVANGKSNRNRFLQLGLLNFRPMRGSLHKRSFVQAEECLSVGAAAPKTSANATYRYQSEPLPHLTLWNRVTGLAVLLYERAKKPPPSTLRWPRSNATKLRSKLPTRSTRHETR